MILNERVNLRTRPNLSSEVVGQLNTGAQVSILDFIQMSDPEQGEPRDWYRIRIPEGILVWVSSEYLEEATGRVTASRLNVRAGPGTHFSVMGRIERDTVVVPVRTTAGWTAIEPVPEAVAYVAAEFVGRLSGSTFEEEIEEGPMEPAPGQLVIDQGEPGEAEPPVPLPLSTPEEPPSVEEGTPLGLSEDMAREIRRIVHREGIIRRSRGILAPTNHRLEDSRTGRTINYLYGKRIRLDSGQQSGGNILAVFEGRKIRLSGEESVDEHFPDIPVIEVESIRTLE